jgi:hypothetical protein
VADAAPYAILNEILWKDAKGADSTVPALRSSEVSVPGGQGFTQPDGGGDEPRDYRD